MFTLRESNAPLDLRTPGAVDRLQNETNIGEIIIAELWAELNTDSSKNLDRDEFMTDRILLDQVSVEQGERVLNRDKVIVNTIIQWLGTACGASFLREFIRRANAEDFKLYNPEDL